MRFFLSKSSFDKAARKHIYSTQNKPMGPEFAKMEIAFIDSNGIVYYKYQDDFELPLERKGKLDKYYQWLSSGMDNKDVEDFHKLMTSSIDDSINTLKLDGRIAGLSRCQKIADEMLLRRQLIVHEDIYFRIAALQYIREDQDPTVWDEQLENEKVEQFKKDSKGGLYAFFYQSPLRKHMAGYAKSEEEWTDYMNEFRASAEALRKLKAMYSSEEK